ncbi:MAG: hypothetical protein BA863_10365 [Desulfovibrio sp. S3730MH75]|nr:MAG: hypothetical protein BA863_10365 [Desulfovibrio sp. S3730MH75]
MKNKSGNPTAYEIKLMRHACAMDSKNPRWRNYFAAENEFEDDEHWQQLVEIGLAEVWQEPNDSIPYRA